MAFVTITDALINLGTYGNAIMVLLTVTMRNSQRT